MEQRLQKIISDYGIASRRAAEKIIADGKVLVNGCVATVGDKADTDVDEIVVDGIKIETRPSRVYIMLNKPRGFVTTMSDEKGRRTVADLVKDVGTKVYPVGRLDMDSEGLIIMTNDGELTNKITHPSYEVKKTYKVWVKDGNIKSASEELRGEMYLDDALLNRADVKVLEDRGSTGVLLITISEGKNRQVRRMCEQVGLTVARLRRVSEGSVSLGRLPRGHWRYLDDKEINHLKINFQN